MIRQLPISFSAQLYLILPVLQHLFAIPQPLFLSNYSFSTLFVFSGANSDYPSSVKDCCLFCAVFVQKNQEVVVILEFFFCSIYAYPFCCGYFVTRKKQYLLIFVPPFMPGGISGKCFPWCYVGVVGWSRGVGWVIVRGCRVACHVMSCYLV